MRLKADTNVVVGLQCTTFDLWGYNHFVDENDQIFHINKFKRWFSGTYLFYPKTMHFHLRPVNNVLFNVLIRFRQRF